jgi:hypothetical protein
MLPLGIPRSTRSSFVAPLSAGAALFLTTGQSHAGKLVRYSLRVLPDSIVLSDAEADVMRDFVAYCLRDNSVTREVGRTKWRDAGRSPGNGRDEWTSKN